MNRILQTVVFMSVLVLFSTIVLSQSLRMPKVTDDVGKIIKNTNFIEFKSDLNTPPSEIFSKHFKSFGLQNASSMILYKTDTYDLGLRHYRFKQTYKNIPVFGAEFIIHERRGLPPTGYGQILADFEGEISHSLSPERAVMVALNEVGAGEYMWQVPENEAMLKKILKDDFATFYPKPQLMFIGPNVFPDMNEYKLVYKVDVYASQPLSYYSIFVDA